MSNPKKFSFIICTNSELYYEECVQYLERLVVPEGYEMEILGVTEARCMTAGYNEGMEASDAKYKIYMHQDVFIIYPYFLQAVLDIFSSDPQIGMIGMVGAEKMAVDGIMWHCYRRGALYGASLHIEDGTVKKAYEKYRYRVEDGVYSVEAIDGLMMITSQDVRWREDLFDGWDFYDASQSMEMIRAGYKVVVPKMKLPWCVHDDGILNLERYDKYRKIYLKEYGIRRS